MNLKFIAPRGAAIALALFSVQSAFASFVIEEAPSAWTRPANSAQASSSLTTYQEWDGFSSPAGPNAATVAINPNGTANAFDSAFPADGAFSIGTDIYSFSASLAPQINVPEFGTSPHAVNVLVQAQSFGGDINTGDLSVTYSDGKALHTVQAGTLPNYSYTQLFTTSTDVGFGLADEVDHAWTFTVPDTSDLQINLGWDAASSAFQSVAVDTQATVPEPATLGLIAGGGLLFMRRRAR